MQLIKNVSCLTWKSEFASQRVISANIDLLQKDLRETET